MSRVWAVVVTWLLVAASTAGTDSTLGTDDRINLVDFGSVVKYVGTALHATQIRGLEREPDGWPAWRENDEDPTSPYLIAVEWDEPRDITQVNVEFRHAIADRNKIKVQYFQQSSGRQSQSTSQPAIGAPKDNSFHGQWVTAKCDWWAGDRDVTFEFLPYNQERPGPNAPSTCYRRTYRIRILCGTREPPPIRHIRAYGPNPHADAILDVRFDPDSKLKPPVTISVSNGYILDGLTGKTRSTTRMAEPPVSVRARYAQNDVTTPTRTLMTLQHAYDENQGFSFLPAQVVQLGIIRIPSLRIVVAHRGSNKNLQAKHQPWISILQPKSLKPKTDARSTNKALK